jgi:hypothetical protein
MDSQCRYWKFWYLLQEKELRVSTLGGSEFFFMCAKFILEPDPATCRFTPDVWREIVRWMPSSVIVDSERIVSSWCHCNLTSLRVWDRVENAQPFSAVVVDGLNSSFYKTIPNSISSISTPLYLPFFLE